MLKNIVGLLCVANRNVLAYSSRLIPSESLWVRKNSMIIIISVAKNDLHFDDFKILSSGGIFVSIDWFCHEDFLTSFTKVS